MFPTFKPTNQPISPFPVKQPSPGVASGPVNPTSGGGPPPHMGGPQVVYVPPTPPPGYYIAPSPIAPTAYGLPPCCPNCGTMSAVADVGGIRFICGYPSGICYGNPAGIKIEVEDPTDCICHITILTAMGCPSARGLPCPSRKKK